MHEFEFRDPIYILSEESMNDALSILGDNPDLVDIDARERFRNNYKNEFGLKPVHSDENPILMDGNTLAFLWCDPQDPENPDLMLAVTFDIAVKTNTANGQPDVSKTLRGIVAGENFEGVLEYRKQCCGQNASAMSVFVALKDDSGELKYAVRDTTLTKAEVQKVFERAPGSVVFSTPHVAHIYSHAKNGMHCGHSHDFLPPVLAV